MSEYVAVLPSIHPPWTDRCLAGLAPEIRDRLLIVDNTIRNRGVAASWNLGIRRMYEAEADWTIILSAALRFGEPGGMDFVAELDTDAVAIEAGHGIGWHLIAFPRRVFDRVGMFDENFFAYWEDIDFARRVSLGFALTDPYWAKVSVDVAIAGFSHGVALAGVKVDNVRLENYYKAKWGGPKGGETNDRPFDDPARGLDWWPPAPRER